MLKSDNFYFDTANLSYYSEILSLLIPSAKSNYKEKLSNINFSSSKINTNHKNEVVPFIVAIEKLEQNKIINYPHKYNFNREDERTDKVIIKFVDNINYDKIAEDSSLVKQGIITLTEKLLYPNLDNPKEVTDF